VIRADINDAGRVALAPRVGQEVQRLDGKIVEKSDTAVELLVSQVTYLNGNVEAWQGQQVTLRPQDVKLVTQRSFSRGRTALFLAALAGGVVAAIAGLKILGITNGDPNRDKGGEPPPDS
jgi:hypothetical protein